MYQLALYQTYLSRAAAVLAAACALSVFLYGTFLLMAVTHTAARAAAERHVASLTAQLGDLEMHYLTAAKDITPERAMTLGYGKPTAVSTVFADASRGVLTLNANR